MSFRLEEFPDRDALMRGAAARIESALRSGITQRGSAAAALSGGSTPEPAYAALARAKLDWTKVTFALVDERWVSPSDPASNEGMLRRALAPALAARAKLLPMWSKAADVAAAAAAANGVYAGLTYDIAIMGMGGDAHTASWFPGTPALADALDPTSQLSVMGLTAPGAAGAPERLTLTLAALARAKQVVLLITGADKRQRLEQAAQQTPEEAPVAALLRFSDRLSVLWTA